MCARRPDGPARQGHRGGRDGAGKGGPSELKVGNRGLVGKGSWTEVKLDGEELIIMKESDIMGVLS